MLCPAGNILFITDLIFLLCSSGSAGQVGLGVGSWSSNLMKAVQFSVSPITLRDLTRECGISLIGTDITV